MLELESDDLSLYLSSSDIIDYNNKNIIDLGDKLFNNSKDEIDYIKNAFEYVRDIPHSADINNNELVYKASDVLLKGHGICFSKSHLLTALLRYKKIPSGFAYQKLILDDINAPILVYHGLNGVFIDKYKKWIRLDPRGNTNTINAQFSIFEEKLAFPVRKEKNEFDLNIIFYKPDNLIIDILKTNKTREDLWNNLPRKLEIDI